MKSKNVIIGETYLSKVSGQLVKVRITQKSIYGGWDAVNLKTRRDVRIKSAARLRYASLPKEVGPSYFAEKIHGLADAARQVAREEKAMASEPLTDKIQ